jgi:hypothetical protein
MEFITLLNKIIASSKPNWKPPEKLLAIDPGETTGVAYFINGELIKTAQLTSIIAIEEAILDFLPDMLIYEDYRIYPAKLKSHSFSEIPTLKIIGAIEYVCEKYHIKTIKQLATMAKGFCNSYKLKEWGYWAKGEQHSRDAIRHGCYFLLFGKEAR